MAWYDTGTVSVTNGSTAVTGSGTNFVAGAQVGEGFYGPDGRLYEIQAIVSATSLTLADAYLGTTQTGQEYKIVPTQSLVADLASQVSTLISDYQSVADNAGEGKFQDGSATSPGITFTLDQDTGFFRDTANEIAVAVAGVKKAEFNSSGMQFEDNSKAIFGAGSDLQIYHTGSVSVIADEGTGNLLIRGSDLRLQNTAGSNNYLKATDGAEVELMHGGATKLATTSTGVDVTGTITADGLTVDGTSVLDSEANFVSDLNASNKSLVLASTGATGGDGQLGASLAFSRINTDSPRAAIAAINTDGNFERMGLSFWTHPSNTADAMVKRMQIDHFGDISFYEDTGTTPKFFWDASAESLGIGTSSADYPMTIYDSATTDGGSKAVISIGSTNAGSSGKHAAIGYVRESGSHGSMLLYTKVAGGITEKMRITSDGLVGIGTSSPDRQLQVESSGAATFALATTNRSAGGDPEYSFGEFDFLTDDQLSGLTAPVAVARIAARANTASTVPGGELAFYTNELGSSQTQQPVERMRITSDGSVGIGTSSPLRPLHVDGGSTDVVALFESDTNAYISMWDGVSGIKIGDLSGDLAFYTGSNSDGAGGSERMRIVGENVGIGTSSPAELIHIAGGAAAAYLKATNSAGTQGIEVGVSSTGDGVVNVQDAKALRLFTSDTERMRLDNNGVLMIGSASSHTGGRVEVTYTGGSSQYGIALRALTDNTDALHFKNAAGGTVGSVSQTATATSYNTSSDYRLKEDVQPMVGASDRVLALNPVNFAWKADGTRVDGFLAHEAQAVVAEAVHGTKDEVDAEGNPVYQGIDQSKLVPLLTAALQEALGRIEALEAEVAALKA